MHGHSHAHDGTRAFAWVTLINLAYTALEAGYGFATNSLALLSDALHNLGDVLGLGLAWAAAAIARRAPTERHTYGWRRATLLSPLANALLLVGFAGALAWEAVRRFAAPPDVPGVPVMVVAAIGIAVNLGAAWFVRGGHAHDLNRKGAFLHLVADAVVSLAAVLAGAVVAFGAFALLRDAFNAAMDAVPTGIRPADVREFLAGQPGVAAVHHLHIWSLGAGEIAMTAHLVRPDDSGHDGFLDSVVHALEERFGINHPTLQVERGPDCGHDRHDHAPHGGH